jgi:hypothetical protein
MKPNNFPIRPSLNGTEELYTQTNNIPQKFILDSAKEFILNPTDIIYSELYDKIVNGELVAGQWYRLTDYRSVNFLNGADIAYNNPTPNDPNFIPREVYKGETEVLLLQAISSYEISPIGYSETFQGDIVQYEPYTDKIGVPFTIYNGNNLPDLTAISGFDLQWDGTDVYFTMPTNYPALFGHYFYVYAEFSGSTYYQDGAFEPLTPNISTAQYPYTSDDPDFAYPKAMSRIRIEEGGFKVVLIDLDYNDFLNYDADTLSVETIYEIENAYGWITRRIDTYRNIDAPFDFRGRKYRRFEVDLSGITASLGTGYWGIGDDYLGQGTTGNYKDFKCFGNDGYDAFNIKWNDTGGAELIGNRGFSDNVVFLGDFYFNQLNGFFSYSTIGTDFFDNVIGGVCFFNTIGNNVNSNNIGSEFAFNTIGSDFSYNTIENGFSDNNILTQFLYNNISKDFNSNEIGANFTKNNIQKDFGSNNIADDFQDNNIGNVFNSNTIGDNFNNNTIANNFSDNNIGDNFRDNTIANEFDNNDIQNGFNNNTIGNSFVNNTIDINCNNNTIGNSSQGNTIGSLFSDNAIGNGFQNNTIGILLLLNTIGNNFASNTIGGFFQSNIIGDSFNSNVIGNNFFANNIRNINTFNNNTIGNLFQRNLIDYSISSINFSAATHVYADYTCRIFKSNDTNLYLEYFSGTTATYVSPTA